MILKLFVSRMAALKLLCAHFQFFPMEKSHFEKIESSKHISSEKKSMASFCLCTYVSVFTFEKYFHGLAHVRASPT